MKKIFNCLCTLLVSLSLIIFSSGTAFAAESSESSARGIWGGEAIANSWESGTFNVYVPNYILRAGMTLKTECSDPNSQGAVLFFVYDSNSRLVTYDEILGPTDEDNTLKIWNAPAGNYKVEYSVQGTSAPVHMYCWIYG